MLALLLIVMIVSGCVQQKQIAEQIKKGQSGVSIKGYKGYEENIEEEIDKLFESELQNESENTSELEQELI